jgi:hypothetical protein
VIEMTATTQAARATAPQKVFALDIAIGFALSRLEELQTAEADQLTPGEVSSLLNDLCLDAGVAGYALPAPLRELRLDAIARSGANVNPRNAPNFILVGLIWTLRASLKQL